MSVEKYRLVLVSYLNTLPFLRGIQDSAVSKRTLVEPRIPSECSASFMSGDADIALLPVAALPKLKNFKLITDFCIGCDGAVRTVALFSHQSIETCHKIYLDSHSNTSNELVKILLEQHWAKSDIIYELSDDPRQKLEKGEAILLIGDKAFSAEKRFDYVYDLGEIWKKTMDLPFVFAVWVARDDVDDRYIQALNEALGQGLSEIESVITKANHDYPDLHLPAYFTENISYHFDSSKQLALEKFLGLMKPSFQIEESMG